MIKELWLLVTLLFKTKPKDVKGKDLEIIRMNYFPRNKIMLVWCGKVFIRKDAYVSCNVLSEFAGLRIAIHEYGHLMQAKSEGSWIKYYLKYLWNWFKHNPFYKYSFYLNKYEMEVYANEDTLIYWDDYDAEYLDIWDLKDARKQFVKNGNTVKSWKQYIKKI